MSMNSWRALEDRSCGARARRRRIAAAVAAALVIGAGTAARAAADTPHDGGTEVIELQVRNDQYAADDKAPEGPSLGDTYVYSGAAVQDGRTVGHGGGTCQVVQVEGDTPTTQCLITIELDRGSLTMQSLWTSGPGSLDMAVTGGTDDFGSARGTARYWDIGTADERVRVEILR
ncbi:hypothetical protein ACFW9D_02375 [Streptomyces sp. NPDC059524]|uniref:allene oxide cyclase barrel-like domain-containing protein n=1 Tax=Streptomyces sp. NPDC059524 TaxID=3346856 RepID=UPI0036BEFEFA